MCAVDEQETALKRDHFVWQPYDPFDLPLYVDAAFCTDDDKVATAWFSSDSSDQKHVAIEQRRLHAGPSYDVQHTTSSSVRLMVKDITALPEGIEDRSVRVNGDVIPYLSAGDFGPWVIMIHGAGGTRREWVESMGTLASGHRVVAPDLIGFGDSPRRDIVHSTKYLGAFLTSFLREVGIERATLVGHSLGGRVCLEVALHEPVAVAGLILIVPMGFGKLSMIGRLLSTGAWWVNHILRRSQPFSKLEVRLEEPDLAIFASVRCDTLLIWGSRDIYFPVAHSARALEAIPNSSLTVYEGGGHAVHLSHLKQFMSSVEAFVATRE